jgi:hypothetical protein
LVWFLGQLDDREAQLLLSIGRNGRLILWIRTGEDSEGWYAVEPAGLRCLYRNGPDNWR